MMKVASRNQIKYVNSFQNLVSIPFKDDVNAMCWSRNLQGDFGEIVSLIELSENIKEVDMEELLALQLSEQGELARNILIKDIEALQRHGASPTLNVIKHYKRDDAYPYFPTDVYSFHVDRSPVVTDTFLCTYFGNASEIIANEEAEQKVMVPDVREELKKLYGGGGEVGFEAFLKEYFFDLHYKPKQNANIMNLGVGNLWKLAVDCPESKILPCIHRAPKEQSGITRLLLIC